MAHKILLFCLMAVSSGVYAAKLPNSLEDWQPWVLKGVEYRLCPLEQGTSGASENDFHCVYYGGLKLLKSNQVWTFELPVTLHRPLAVPLPGDATIWPMLTNQDAAAVVMKDEQPQVFLPAGTHLLTGRFLFTTAPTSIPIPSNIPGVRVDGQPGGSFYPNIVANRVSLFSENAPAEAAGFRRITVFRRITDAIPARDETRIHIQAAGQSETINFGSVTLEGFSVLSLESSVPAVINSKQELELQIRPGDYWVTIHSRSKNIPSAIKSLGKHESWPVEEIWSFEAQNELRSVLLDGLAPVDPQQSQVPSEWQSTPAFLYKKGEILTVKEQFRGLAARSSKLHLERSAWLDFEGKVLTFTDTLKGQMYDQNRLDLKAPFDLQYATAQGQPQVLSQGQDAAFKGLELRQSEVDLFAVSEAKFRRSLPISGWSQNLQGVTFRLNLPPGYDCLHAEGAESSQGTWTDQWNLWQSFIVCFILALIFRLYGWKFFALAILPIVWFHQVGRMPTGFLINLLLANFALGLANERLRPILRAYAKVSAFVLVVGLVPFIAHEIRSVLHPQLEDTTPAPDLLQRLTLNSESVYAPPSRPEVQEAPPPKMKVLVNPNGNRNADAKEEADAPQSFGDDPSGAEVNGGVKLERLSSSGKRVIHDKTQLPAVSIGAGPGIPNWVWKNIRLDWNGPVAGDQSFRIYIINRWQKALLTLVSLLLLLVLVRPLLLTSWSKDQWTRLQGVWLTRSLGVLILVAMSLPSQQGWASDMPTPELLKELKERLIEAPKCAPECVTISQARLTDNGTELTLEMMVDAQQLSSFQLPSIKSGWRLLSISNNGRATGISIKDDKNWGWVAAGHSQIVLKGPLISKDRVSFRFPMRPMHLTFDLHQWQVESLESALADGEIELIARQKQAESVSQQIANLQALADIEREIHFDKTWIVTTTVTSNHKGRGPLQFDLQLLPGESLAEQRADVAIKEGSISIKMEPNQESLIFNTLIPSNVESLQLKNTLGDHAVTWKLRSTPLWQIQYSGTPLIETDLSILTFRPRDQETLDIQIKRPIFAGGAAVAFDDMHVKIKQGELQSSGTAELNYRSTRGLDHYITVPAAWHVTRLTINGSQIPMHQGEQGLRLPLQPGSGKIALDFELQRPVSWNFPIALPDLKAVAANIRVNLETTKSRWILWTSGGVQGPVILYWNALVLFSLLAFFLSRAGITILKFWQWLLLGWGLAGISWWIIILFSVWLIILQLRHKKGQALTRWVRLEQTLLILLSVLAVSTLIGSVAYGLLSEPDMAVAGENSRSNFFEWFYDYLSTASQQTPWVFSLPIWIYKLAMLVWAIWLAFSILDWIRYAWAGISKAPLSWKKDAVTPAEKD